MVILVNVVADAVVVVVGGDSGYIVVVVVVIVGVSVSLSLLLPLWLWSVFCCCCHCCCCYNSCFVVAVASKGLVWSSCRS